MEKQKWAIINDTTLFKVGEKMGTLGAADKSDLSQRGKNHTHTDPTPR